MTLLLDTQLLIWSLSDPKRVPVGVQELIADRTNVLSFSSVSIWEIAIKQKLGRPGFLVDADMVLRQLRVLQYKEFPFTSEHALVTRKLPLLHQDPFDRGLLAQAVAEGLTLVTVDATLGTYGDPVARF